VTPEEEDVMVSAAENAMVSVETVVTVVGRVLFERILVPFKEKQPWVERQLKPTQHKLLEQEIVQQDLHAKDVLGLLELSVRRLLLNPWHSTRSQRAIRPPQRSVFHLGRLL
jgi:hypothetical protein